MTAEFLDPAFSTKVRFYPKSKHNLIRRSKLKKVRSFEDSYLRCLEKSNQYLIHELERQESEGPERPESWMLGFRLEMRDEKIDHLFEMMEMAVDLITSLNNNV